MSWLENWRYRKKFIIDHTKISNDLTWFPIVIFLDDVDVFNEIGKNRYKIAFTKDDGTTQLYAEIERWDWMSKKAVIHISKSDWVISSTNDTVFYMYFDNSKPDNTNYAGDIGSTPAQKVWDNNFMGVWHLNTLGSAIRKDSSINGNDGAWNGETNLIHDILYVDDFKKYSGNPILSGTEAWESDGIRDPTFLLTPDGYAVKENGLYILYYNGKQTIDGNEYRKVGRATSPDGIHWTKDPNNPIFSDTDYTAMASVIKKGDNDYIMYYKNSSGGFNYATSLDGVHWTPNTTNAPILSPSDFGLSNIALPFVTQIGNTWYMVFEGAGSVWNIYMATSSDGYSWTPVNNGNPIYTSDSGWDSYAQANPSLYEIDTGKYIICYNGETQANDWNLGILYSTSLTSGWTTWKNNPILTKGTSGEFDSVRMEGMRILKDDIRAPVLRLWYFGLDTTDSYQDGRIGYATCEQTIEGKADGANKFNGSTNYIEIPDSDSLSSLDMTVEACVKGGKLNQAIVYKGSSSSDREYVLGTSNELTYGKMQFRTIKSGDASVYNTAKDPNEWDVSNWHYVVGRNNDATHTVDLFIDATLVASDNTNDYSMGNLTSPLNVGRYGGNTLYYGGLLDEIRLSNIVRDENWINATYYTLFDALIQYGEIEFLNLVSAIMFGANF